MNQLKKNWNKLSYRWFKFKFALRHAKEQFKFAYKDKVELTKDYLDKTGKYMKRSNLSDHQFMVRWKSDTELMINHQRQLMAKENLDIENFRSKHDSN